MAAKGSGGTQLRTWNPHTQYDVSSQEMTRIVQRAEMRNALKKEWQMKSSNPYRGTGRGGYIFDPAVQRFYSLRAWGWHYFKATPRTAAFGLLTMYGPILLTYKLLKNDKQSYNAECQNGLPYADRKFKFI